MKNLIYKLDKALAIAFTVLGLGALYGVIAKGAWWHIGTMVICAVMAVALWNDEIVDEGDPDYE